jgi:4-amino-4-deoxy-L-arabinose transferase-like glycosyltransferase
MRVFFDHSTPNKRGEKTNAPAHRLLLSAILALSAFLNLSWLTSEGYANVYYAATVKNMLASWHNFFFASYDAGFVSVDKPPLGLWIQAASAYLFDFHGWSLLLPQALAGVLCVALLYYLVGRSFGAVAGLLAALALALSPISVATNRHNNLESLLVLAVLLAAWAFILAAETGRLRWLVVGGRGWLLPLILLGTASLQLHILVHYPDWSHWLVPTIVVPCLAAAASLVVARLTPRLRYPLAAISLGVGSLFLAPSLWAASTVWYGAETRSPTAGPRAEASELSSRFGSEGGEVDPLVDYLEANQGDAEYLVAAIDSGVASPIILNTDEPVIAFGGFEGRDRVFSIERFADLARRGPVRFFIIKERDIEHAAQPDTARHHLELGGQVPRLDQLLRLKTHLKSLADIHERKQVRWITDNCEQAPEGLWQSSTSRSSTSTLLLYNCGTRGPVAFINEYFSHVPYE